MKKSTTSTAETHGNGNRSETTSVFHPKGTKHDANLRKNGFIHFQIGLILAMLLVYFGLEFAVSKMNTFVPPKNDVITDIFVITPDLRNIIIEKSESEKKIKPKVINPTEFIIKPNEFEDVIKKEFINHPVPSGSEDLLASQINVPKVPTINEMVFPITAVEEAPIFPGCEKVEKSELRACFEEKMQKHILRNFKYPEEAIETRTQGKVFVMFTIGKDGVIEEIKLRGSAKILEIEAERIIDKLPQMTPGKRKNKPVRVSYSIPINFQLQ